MSLLAVAASVALAMAPEPAVQTSAPAQQMVASANPVICHNEAVPGSRIGAFHVCMRQSDWDARSTRAREYLVDIQNRGEALR